MSSASYGGYDLGRSVSVDDNQAEPEYQHATAFGTSGVYSIYGGGRGRAITVTAVAYGDDEAAVDEAISGLEDMADGVTRDLAKPGGGTISNVILLNVKASPKYGYGHEGVLKKYSASFMSLGD